ncbi:MAG: pteridine reductase [Nevskiales bacterium]
MDKQCVLITGAGRRIGAAIAQELHKQGARVLIHYRHAEADAHELATMLNAQRAGSAACLQADLLDTGAAAELVLAAAAQWGRLDGLVNSASSFYPTPLGEIDENAWVDLVGSNFKAPLFLSQAAAKAMQTAGGSIVNIIDIHVQRSLPGHAVYTAAKAALASLTKSLARDLAPAIRVNGVAPGTILWPEHDVPDAQRAEALQARIPMRRIGEPADIARAVRFLMSAEAAYITGQILAVDGGASLV